MRTIHGRAAAILLAAGFLFPVEAGSQQAGRIDTSADQALMVDGETGTVLMARNPDEAFPPASLAKLMTMEIAFSRIRSGDLSLDDTFPVSEYAWRTGGAPSGSSTMFAELNSSVPVSALIRGTIVQSANDAAIILAEGLAGSEEAFVERMNERAAELGLEGTRFANATGLPADGQQVTARDLVTLARHLRTTYPDLYRIYSEPSFEWNGIFQRNRNPLLSMGLGADGMGTGYTEASGFSLVGAAEANGRTTYLALGGLDSAAERSEEARMLLEYARDNFEQRRLVEAGQILGSAEVFGGARPRVGLAPARTVDALLPVDRLAEVKATIRYDAPVPAPVSTGDRLAVLDVGVGDSVILSVPLEAAGDVASGGFTEQALGAARELATGWLRAF